MDTLRIQITGDFGNLDIAIPRESAFAATTEQPLAIKAGGVAEHMAAERLPIKPAYTKILADGTRVHGDDPRTDHVALIDHAAGLMWSVESLGDEGDSDAGLDHAGCTARCASLRLLGYDDWRLPTRSELVRLIDDTRRDPAIDVALFPRVKPKWHWTSTPWIDRNGQASASDAWCVGFSYGGVNYDFRYGHGCALAVRRAGQ